MRAAAAAMSDTSPWGAPRNQGFGPIGRRCRGKRSMQALSIHAGRARASEMGAGGPSRGPFSVVPGRADRATLVIPRVESNWQLSRGRLFTMQAVSRRGLAQVPPRLELCRTALPPVQLCTHTWGFVLQARGRLLQSKAVNEASFASIAGLEKVGPGCKLPGACGTSGRGFVHIPSPMSFRTCPLPQAPMSRMEQDQFINDRYQAIEERLQVGPQPAMLAEPLQAAL